MKKYNLYLSEKQITQLMKMSKDKDISVSELIRRALDNFIESEASKAKALMRMNNES